MLETINFYFQLGILCLRLIWNLTSFAFKVALNKIEKKASLNYLLVLLILLSTAVNFYVLNQKNQVKTEFLATDQSTLILHLEKESHEQFLSQEEIGSSIQYHEQLKSQKIKNLFILINLNQLFLAANNKELAQEYLKQAQQISPKTSYRE